MQLWQPRKVLLEELHRDRVPVERRDRVYPASAASAGVVTIRSATDGNQTHRAAAKSDRPYCQPTCGRQYAKRGSTDGKEPDSKSANRHDAPSHATASKPTRGDVAQCEYPARVPPHLSALQVRADGNCPQRQATEHPLRLSAYAFPRKPANEGSREQLGLCLHKLLLGQRALRPEFGESFEFVYDVHGL